MKLEVHQVIQITRCNEITIPLHCILKFKGPFSQSLWTLDNDFSVRHILERIVEGREVVLCVLTASQI